MGEDRSGPIAFASLVGALLKQARGKKTQEWVAEQTGLGLRTVGDIERGARNCRSYNVAAYALAVGVKPAQLSALHHAEAAKHLDTLLLGSGGLDEEDQALIADARAKRRKFGSHLEWVEWMHKWAPDLCCCGGAGEAGDQRDSGA